MPRTDLVVAFFAHYATPRTTIMFGDDDPAVFVAGVVRIVHYRLNDDGLVTTRLLADNTHTRPDTFLADLTSPLVHALVAWRSADQFVQLGDILRGAGITSEVFSTLARQSFDPLRWFAHQLGEVDLALLGPEDLAPKSAHVESRPLSPRDGDVWGVAAAMRATTQHLDRLVHVGAMPRGLITADNLPVADEHIPDTWRSPHVEHPEVPMSTDRKGQFKYLIPTGGWWTYLDIIASQRSPRS
jgi:hypothetical protein